MPAIISRLFRFKQFTVQHHCSSMKVGTDAVLLGAWCDLTHARRVLDVGTGCGVIALIAAQRTGDACTIDAIDIDEASVREAHENFLQSSWSNRLSVRCVDYNTMSGDGLYDAIITNPPYYIEDVLPPDAIRSAARHTHALSFGQLFDVSSRLLTSDGTLALITPIQAKDDVMFAATIAHFHLSRLTTVYPVQGRPGKRLLWLWSLRRCATQYDTLTLHHKSGERTAAYQTLCQDFYL